MNLFAVVLDLNRLRIKSRGKKFVRQHKRPDSAIQRLADRATHDIIMSADPADLGAYRQDMKAFSHELGRKRRV